MPTNVSKCWPWTTPGPAHPITVLSSGLLFNIKSLIISVQCDGFPPAKKYLTTIKTGAVLIEMKPGLCCLSGSAGNFDWALHAGWLFG